MSNTPFIATADNLARFLAGFPDGEACGIDIEADSLHVYQEKICLIQFVCDGREAIFDPLAIKDFGALHDFVKGRRVWLHGADYDLTLWYRTFGYMLDTGYDTQLAARFLGFESLGLAAVVKSVFDVQLDKGPQKANWGKRPLGKRMLEYAASDVRYLLPMAEKFEKKLRELGRWDWYEQSSEYMRRAVLERPVRPADDVWKINGWGKLPPRAMAYLRAFWHWRDEIAERWDRPPFKVMSNRQMLEAATTFASGGKVEISRKFPPYVHKGFRKALKEAASLSDAELPRRKRAVRMKKAKDWEPVFDVLKERRDHAAAELKIDPALISARSTIEAYAFAVEGRDQLEKDLFLPWQRELMFNDSIQVETGT